MPRIRKAWRVVLAGRGSDLFYAPNANKAKYAAYLSIEADASFSKFLQGASIFRETSSDRILPDRHPLASLLHPKILDCLSHAYGGRGLKAGYRDHFYTSDTNHWLKAAYYHGLFSMYRVDKTYAGSRTMIMYELTTLGKNVAAGEVETYPRC